MTSYAPVSSKIEPCGKYIQRETKLPPTTPTQNESNFRLVLDIDVLK